MGFRNWAYYFRHAATNILSNRLVHAISIGTISISLVLFGFFLLFFVNLNTWLMEWGQSLSMSVYIEDGLDDAGTKRIESVLKNLPGAEIKGFTSKEQAMRVLAKGLGAQSGLLDGITENPLPASFEIVFRDVSINEVDPKKTKEYLEKIEGVDEVQYSERWLERFEGLMYVLKVVGLGIAGFLCLAVLFITTNTIKLTIYSRRDEIEIFKLVGATDWFVKIPFLIEGAVQGIFGGLIALFILFLVYSVISLKRIHLIGLPVLDIVFLPNEYVVFILSLSLVLGLMGSLVAVGRFFDL